MAMFPLRAWRRPVARGAIVAAVLLAWPSPLGAEQNEIDTFMERVLERRGENWVHLHGYVLDERETLKVVGPAGVPLQSFDREYVWYVRDGFLIRSPLRFDGVDLGEQERRTFEEDWLRQERRRAENPGLGSRRRPRSTRSTFDNIMITIERLWGRRVSEELGRALAEDALLWEDDAAAVAAGTDRIVSDLGGVDAIGFDTVVARTRELFVMLETERLERPQVAAVMSEMLPILADALKSATDADVDLFVELIQLAAVSALRLPDVAPALAAMEAELIDRGAAGSASRLAHARGALEATAAAGGDEDIHQAGVSVGIGLQPRFISEAYFLDFEFEPGNYYFAGRDEVAGREVMTIEYYPQRLFSEAGADDGADSREDRIDAGFDKTSLVTLWIDPEEYQIVKFTFDNVGFEFLPMRWLVRLDDLTVSMVMSQPFEGVWLPESVELRGQLTLATGSFNIIYSRDFSNYRRAETRARIRAYGNPQD